MVIASSYSFGKGRKLLNKLNVLLQQGFARICIDNQIVRLDDFVATLEMIDETTLNTKEILLIVDRIVVKTRKNFTIEWLMPYKLHFMKEKANCTFKMSNQMSAPFSILIFN